jgi:hypothetical protein
MSIFILVPSAVCDDGSVLVARGHHGHAVLLDPELGRSVVGEARLAERKNRAGLDLRLTFLKCFFFFSSKRQTYFLKNIFCNKFCQKESYLWHS